MIRALFWKEYREQRLIAFTLAAFSIVSLFLVYQWNTNQELIQKTTQESALGISVCLAILTGLVTGAMLLAEEQESRTQPYLDALPSWRRNVWLGKTLF